MILSGIICILGILFCFYLIFSRPEQPSNKLKVAYAANLHDNPKLILADITQIPEQLDVDGAIIKTADYEVFQVEGESMQKRDIHSGDIVFCRSVPLSELLPKNIIVLRIPNQMGSYKLREFVRFIERSSNDTITFDVELSQKIKECMEAYKDENTFIISNTFDVFQDKDRYSVHPALLLEGRVYYKIEKTDL